ncbi:MBL fold metallo-hydrolase [Candidatus Microgenomates bacterium]|nr:MAG: MBL fold metallo-hydrolase [Candidatus Microgenomates bacterium]
MRIVKYSLGQLQANCYFLIEENNCLIVDPADDASFILEELQRQQLNLVGMLATHGHFDHIGAVGEIQLSFDVPLYIFKEDKFLIDRLNETAKYFLGFDPNFIKPKNVKFLKQGDISITNFKFNILSSPGHTPGSGCFYFKEENTVFTGDTLFKEGIGRTDLSYSSKEDLKNSLKKIFKLPKETIVCSGHGEETILEDEIRTLQLIN